MSMSNSEAWPNLRQRIADLVASGRTDAIETLLTEHPNLRSDEQLLLDCIYAEFCFREDRNQTPQPTEYLNRFPQYVKQLRALFEVHEALDTPGLLDAAAAANQQSAKRLPDDDATLLPESPAKRPTETSSRRIGPYKLLQLIGEGGMGAVYMSHHGNCTLIAFPVFYAVSVF